jgi:uncharacterized protein (TIGR02271 family)
LRIGTRPSHAGTVRARKSVETHPVEEEVSRLVEEADVESIPAESQDSGEIETLPDGSISIPVLEEQLVVTKRLVVRERIVIRKNARTEREVIRDELRKEQVSIETEGDVDRSRCRFAQAERLLFAGQAPIRGPSPRVSGSPPLATAI